MNEPLTLTVARMLAHEPDVVLVRLGVEYEAAYQAIVEFDVIVAGRTWELCALPAKMARVIEDHERLQAWIGGNLTPIGPIVNVRRTLADRLTPVRAYADRALPCGARVVFDELDHVVPANAFTQSMAHFTCPDGAWQHARGIVIDTQPDAGTVDVILV